MSAQIDCTALTDVPTATPDAEQLHRDAIVIDRLIDADPGRLLKVRPSADILRVKREERSGVIPGFQNGMVFEEQIGIGTGFIQGHDPAAFQRLGHDKGYACRLTHFGASVNPLEYAPWANSPTSPQPC